MIKQPWQRSNFTQKIILLLTASAAAALMEAIPAKALESSTRLAQAAEASATEERSQQAHQLMLLAKEQIRLWDYQDAITFLEKALTIFREVDNPLGEAEALTQLGAIYFFNLDQPDRAIASLSEAIVISDSIGASGERLFVKYFALNYLGDVYSSLGQHEQAIDTYQQALTMMQNYEVATTASLSSALMQVGHGYSGARQYERALEFHNQALGFAKAGRDFEMVEIALANIGNVYEASGQYEKAIDFYQQTLDLTQEFAQYRYYGTIDDNKHYDKLTARYLLDLGRAYLQSGQLQLAEKFLAEAVYLFEILRSAGLNDTANITELETLEGAYYFLQRALSLQGKPEAALEVAERSRAQAFSELLAQQLIPDAEATPGAPPNLDQLKAIAKEKQSLVILYPVAKSNPEPVDTSGSLFLVDIWVIFPDGRVESRQYVLSDEKITALAATTRQATQVLKLDRIDTLPQFSFHFPNEAQIEEYSPYGNYIEQRILSDFTDSLTDINIGVAEILEANPNQNVIYAPDLSVVARPDIQAIKSIAQEQQATLVEYSITDVAGLEPMLSIWVVMPNGNITFRRQSLAGVDMAQLVSNTRQTIGVRGDRAGIQTAFTPEYIAQQQDRADENLTQLHELLIEPIADLLPADPSQPVVFIPERELFLVPFAALKNNKGNYLVENHTILTAPSIQVLQLTEEIAKTRQSTSINQPLIVGNPTMPSVTLLNNEGAFNDVRLNPLVGAQQEAEEIATFLQSSALIGAQATEATVKQQLASADLIHLATHGLLEYGDPRETGSRDAPGAIALSPGGGEDGLLTSREILQMNLQADLAVLSACDTGRGRITGDGVIGLSRSFIAAGVPSVIVSLWAVPDSPTAELMTEFYRQLEQGQSKAQALRQAMLITMQTYPNPQDWAAFTLIGESE